MALGTKVGLSPGNFVLHGTQPPPQKGGGAPPQFSAHFCCGQTAGCIKMPLGMEVGLGPGHTVLDGVPALRERATAAPPLFGACLLWPRSPVSATAELLLYNS